MLPGEKATVSVLCANPNKQHLAVGYSDGNVLVYSLKTAEVISTFAGHRSEITCLAYDNYGHKLASGSKVRKEVRSFGLFNDFCKNVAQLKRF